MTSIWTAHDIQIEGQAFSRGIKELHEPVYDGRRASERISSAILAPMDPQVVRVQHKPYPLGAKSPNKQNLDMATTAPFIDHGTTPEEVRRNIPSEPLLGSFSLEELRMTAHEPIQVEPIQVEPIQRLPLGDSVTFQPGLIALLLFAPSLALGLLAIAFLTAKVTDQRGNPSGVLQSAMASTNTSPVESSLLEVTPDTDLVSNNQTEEREEYVDAEDAWRSSHSRLNEKKRALAQAQRDVDEATIYEKRMFNEYCERRQELGEL